MPLVKEYRITLPVSVEEYRVAQVYTIARTSKEHTSGGEGVEIVENRSYGAGEEGAPQPADGASCVEGRYTHKIYHIGSKLPGWLKAICPTSALQVSEKAWNAYPYCKTVYSCPFLGDRFHISVTTRYVADNGTSENAMDLSDKELKEREVDVVDIVKDPIDPNKYKPEEDPSLFESTKTGRGKLKDGWRDTTTPVMTSYKLCSVEFRYWGLQSRIESFIHKVALRDTFLVGHRQAFCWIDEWFGLSMDEVLQIEKQSAEELNKLRGEEGEEGGASFGTQE